MNTQDSAAASDAGQQADLAAAPARPGAPDAPRARKKSQQALDDYLSALFPMRAEGAASVGERVPDEDAVWIERERIEPNPAQPRRTWSVESLRELGQSLARDGQLQACVVRPHPGQPGSYQLVSGERRWRAAGPELANLPRLRCTIREVGDDESMRLALVENLQREDLNDIDKARAFVDLRRSLRAENPRVTWSHIGEAVGLSREYLQRLKALLDLPAEVQEMVRGGVLSGRSARVLTGLKSPEQQLQLARDIQRLKLTSDQALQRARSLDRARPGSKNNRAQGDQEVTREPQGGKQSKSGSWEEPLRQAVLLLAQAREHPQARAGKRGKRAKQLIEQARAHIEALAQDGEKPQVLEPPNCDQPAASESKPVEKKA